DDGGADPGHPHGLGRRRRLPRDGRMLAPRRRRGVRARLPELGARARARAAARWPVRGVALRPAGFVAEKRARAARRGGTMAKARAAASREVRDARVEIEKGVARVARSVAEIQAALGRAERMIEANARERIRELRKEAKGQLALLRKRRREASKTLARLSTAAGDSWRDVKKAADRTLADARTVAD